MASMVRVAVGLAVLLTVAPSRPWAQETPAVKDPISPGECRKDKKKAPDCQRLGLLYATGEQVPVDAAKAAAYLDAACHAQAVNACRQLGWFLITQQARVGDVERGTSLLSDLCRRKDFAACTVLGGAYVNGVGVARDVRAGAQLLDTACSGLRGDSCVLLAKLLDADDVPVHDRARARMAGATACTLGEAQMCEWSCQRGEANACLSWAVRLSATDPAEADRAYRLACDAGAAIGCQMLAAHAADEASAATLYERACTLGDASGCVPAGDAYYLGRGVTASLGRASDLYSKACEADDRLACRVLGGIYARGELGAAQAAGAQGYLLKACDSDTECREAVGAGSVPRIWGGSYESLRPARRDEPGAVDYDQAPELLRRTAPVYPKEAFVRGIEGTVRLRLRIDELGRIVSLRSFGGPPLLDAAAIACVRQWLFAPARRDGAPVSAEAEAPISFKIFQGRGTPARPGRSGGGR